MFGCWPVGYILKTKMQDFLKNKNKKVMILHLSKVLARCIKSSLIFKNIIEKLVFTSAEV
jgi:hypothetical protein